MKSFYSKLKSTKSFNDSVGHAKYSPEIPQEIEDTLANYDDFKQAFGEEMATSVAQLSKDMRLPKKQREGEFLQEFDNLSDTDAINADKLSRIVRKAESILSTLEAKDNPNGILVEAAVEEVQSRLLEVRDRD